MFDLFFDIATSHRVGGLVAQEDILMAREHYESLLKANKSSQIQTHATQLERYLLEAIIDWFDLEACEEVSH